MSTQYYEDYWSLTLEYTNFNSVKFLKTLEIVVDKIDHLNLNKSYVYDEIDYKKLQKEVLAQVPKSSSSISNQLASTRKAINQCVKLGFVNPFLQSYLKETREYLAADTDNERQTLLSKIIYSNSKFNSSVKKSSTGRHINFLIKTLEKIGVLNKSQILGLMLVNIEEYKSGFIEKDELDIYTKLAIEIDFISRKYNQFQYLCNLLSKLDNVKFINDKLYFTDDPKIIIKEKGVNSSGGRDPYLQRIYKNLLESEVIGFYGKRICMVEKISYPVLIASHIKPFIDSDDDEAYDPDNGLLLSKNIDSLFDLKHITFADDGSIIYSSSLSEDVIDTIKSYKLDLILLNQNRRKYLQYHRKLFREKNGIL